MESITRIFLTNYAEFERSIYVREFPKYLSSYNFMSLLNLPRHIDNYLSLRYLWEGKDQGEGYLRTVKSELTIGLNKKWEMWLVNNLLLEKSFNNISSKIVSPFSFK